MPRQSLPRRAELCKLTLEPFSYTPKTKSRTENASELGALMATIARMQIPLPPKAVGQSESARLSLAIAHHDKKRARAHKSSRSRRRKDAVPVQCFKHDRSEKQLPDSATWRMGAIESRSRATLDAWKSCTKESLAGFIIWPPRPHRTRGRKLVGNQTPGRAIKDALKRDTQVSLDSRKKISEDGEYTHWSDNLAASVDVEVREGDESRANKRYLTPEQRELLSVVRILSNPHPDGRVYSDSEIAQRLQITARRVQKLRVRAEYMWRKHGKTYLGMIYQRSLTKEYMTKNEQVKNNVGTEGHTGRSTDEEILLPAGKPNGLDNWEGSL